MPAASPLVIGLRENLTLFLAQLVQVFFCGALIGMQRTVMPPLAEADFGLDRGGATQVAGLVISFGLVKAGMNLVSGMLAERLGRRPLLLAGWIAALPIPLIFWAAPSWGWVLAGNMLLGVNQGFVWSMTVTGKMDIARADQRGLATGLNECIGYGGVALAGIAAGYLAMALGPRAALASLGGTVVLAALAHGALAFRESLPHARHQAGNAVAPDSRQGSLFALVTWRDPALSALTLAGHVEKYVDALVWLAVPLAMAARGMSLADIGWVAGTYGLVWGLGQLWSGPLSDRVGRRRPAVAGMALAAAGSLGLGLVAGMPALVAAAALTGLGMALLYPTLIAAVGDRAHPAWRGAALGVYRFWRDAGYALGALAIGLAADLTGWPAAPFVLTATLMAGSALWLNRRLIEEVPAR